MWALNFVTFHLNFYNSITELHCGKVGKCGDLVDVLREVNNGCGLLPADIKVLNTGVKALILLEHINLLQFNVHNGDLSESYC